MKSYVIKEGSHYHDCKMLAPFKTFNIGSVINVEFTDSCLYMKRLPSAEWFQNKYPDDFNQLNEQVNKLIGFSFGLFPHVDSVRIGWNNSMTDPNLINLYSYVYRKGKRTIKKITSVSITDKVRIQFYIDKQGRVCYHVEVKTGGSVISVYTDVMIEKKPGSLLGRWQLSPYFGGRAPAPNDIQINIEII